MGDLAELRGRGPALTSRHFLALVRTRGLPGNTCGIGTQLPGGSREEAPRSMVLLCGLWVQAGMVNSPRFQKVSSSNLLTQEG